VVGYRIVRVIDESGVVVSDSVGKTGERITHRQVDLCDRIRLEVLIIVLCVRVCTAALVQPSCSDISSARPRNAQHGPTPFQLQLQATTPTAATPAHSHDR
jgi:hypothetical protein